MSQKLIIASILFFSSFLAGCVDFESKREVLMRQSDDYRKRGFSMNASEYEKEADKASPARHLVITNDK